MKLRIFDVLLPREVAFFKYMNEQVDVFYEACKEFKDLVDNINTLPEREIHRIVNDIKLFEEKGDDIETHIIEELDKTFITPLDREDIHAIATNLDHSLDALNSAAQKIEIYKIKKRPKNIRKFATIIVDISGELKKLINSLEKKSDASMAIKRIHKLENEADALFHSGLADLFDNEDKDAIEIIKLKGLFEQMEDTVNSVHDLAKLISGVKIKHG